MPVVRGAASTRRQILAYSLVLVPLGLAPAFTHSAIFDVKRTSIRALPITA
jgi:heme O synthase-like polyprenyltransferase